MIYIQIIGPDKTTNEKFVEKMFNSKYSILNNFKMTTEKEYDPKAYKSYFILPNNLAIDEQEKQSWIEYYLQHNNMTWVAEF